MRGESRFLNYYVTFLPRDHVDPLRLVLPTSQYEREGKWEEIGASETQVVWKQAPLKGKKRMAKSWRAARGFGGSGPSGVHTGPALPTRPHSRSPPSLRSPESMLCLTRVTLQPDDIKSSISYLDLSCQSPISTYSKSLRLI